MLDRSPWPPCRMFLFAYLLIFMSVRVECQVCSTTAMNAFEGSHYVIVSNYGRAYAEARSYCQGMGGDLPIITSAEQNEYIAGLLLQLSWRTRYWIGLHDMDMDGSFRWIDGSAPGYLNWVSNPPTSAYCAFMISESTSDHGNWTTIDCLSERLHMCEIPLDTSCTWHTFGDTQYLIAEDTAIPADAEAVCQSYGGNLALIKTKTINDFLYALLPKESGCYLFGLSRRGFGDFAWLDGTSSEYTSWFPPDPNELDSWGCFRSQTSFTELGQWSDSGRSTARRYICERRRAREEGNESEFNNITYFVSPHWMRRNFADSRTYCQHHGGDLALIRSGNINDFLQDASPQTPSSCFWFGLTDQTMEGSFVWIDGTSLVTPFWAPNEPNDMTGINDCVCRYSSTLSQNKEWNDSGCLGTNPFICERPKYFPESSQSQIGETLYYVSQNWKTSYSFARKVCQDQGGDLAQPKTEEINTLLLDMAGGVSYWFGLDSINEDGTFRWVDGTNLQNNIFPTWSGMSNALWDGERCVHQFVTTGWSERPCESYIKFACEKSILLPRLAESPELLDFGLYYVAFSWSLWNPVRDAGGGPVICYKVYIQSGDEIVLEDKIVPGATNPAILTYNATDLHQRTSYSIRISAIRDGTNGEGEKGPALQITTLTMPTRVNPMTTESTTSGPTSRLVSESSGSTHLPSWVLFGVSMLGNMIFLTVVVCLCCQLKRVTSNLPPLSSSAKTTSDPSPFVNPVFDASGSDAHSYQDLKKSDKDPTYDEIDAARKKEYVNVAQLQRS